MQIYHSRQPQFYLVTQKMKVDQKGLFKRFFEEKKKQYYESIENRLCHLYIACGHHCLLMLLSGPLGEKAGIGVCNSATTLYMPLKHIIARDVP